MVYNFVKRESSAALLTITMKSEDKMLVKNRLTPHMRRKSDPMVTLSMSTPDEERDRQKSPTRNAKLSSIKRVSSSDKKVSLLRKKSSKEKDQLIKANIPDSLDESSNESQKIIDTCECDKNCTKQKTRTKKLSKSNILFDAVLDDDFSLVRKLIITDELDIDEVTLEGSSALHFAAAAGNLNCMELLLECGARVNAVDDYLRTPLEYAVIYGHFDCATLLIASGADTNVIKDGIL